MARKIFQVCEIEHIPSANGMPEETKLKPFWGGTVSSHSQAVKRHTTGVEDLTKTFTVYAQVGNPKKPDGSKWVGSQIGSATVISCEEVKFVGFKSEYRKLYGIVQMEVQ